MSVRSEREKSKMQEKYQIILAQMLKEDDNRFCADCDTKSPRWTSWNLGIFICIRCAGFHRNLGVHISKVKSVNLDSWTPEQIASMQAMGNNRARAVYEANLPQGFRRPQTDSALEAFIRAKYEQRKWLAKDWIPPEITVSSDLIESETNSRRNESNSDLAQGDKSNSTNIPKLKGFTAPISNTNSVRQTAPERSVPPVASQTAGAPTPISVAAPVTVAPPARPEPLPDLLSLDEPSLPPSASSNSLNVMATKQDDPLHDLFLLSTPIITTPTPTTTTTTTTTTNTNNNLHKDLESAFSSTSSSTSGGPMTTDKILALFNQPAPVLPTATPMNQPLVNFNNPSGGLVTPQGHQTHFHAHHKSASYGGNLYQQANNNFPIRPIYPMATQPYPNPSQPGFSPMTPTNPYAGSTPTLQSPASTFTPDQLNNQFSQFVPFANTKTSTTASALISGMPTRPVTEMMPASSDLLWQ